MNILFKIGCIINFIGGFLVVLATYPLWVIGESSKDQDTAVVLLLIAIPMLLLGPALTLVEYAATPKKEEDE